MASEMKVSRARARHYQWGQGADGWQLLNQPGLSVIEEIMPPGSNETAHWHSKARQFFYVLEGTLVLQFSSSQVELNSGEGFHIAPEQVHQARNDSDENCRFLVISSPHSHGDRVDVTLDPKQTAA